MRDEERAALSFERASDRGQEPLTVLGRDGLGVRLTRAREAPGSQAEKRLHPLGPRGAPGGDVPLPGEQTVDSDATVKLLGRSDDRDQRHEATRS